MNFCVFTPFQMYIYISIYMFYASFFLINDQKTILALHISFTYVKFKKMWETQTK